MTQDRRTCSIGWPNPRSVASEKAATSSANPRPESRSPGCTAQAYAAWARRAPAFALRLWGEPRTTAARVLPTVDRRPGQNREDAMSTTLQDKRTVARWSVGGAFLEA